MTRHAMKKCVIAPLCLLMAALAGWSWLAVPDAQAGLENSTMLAHNVYFTLSDHSPEARKTLVEACKKYLSDHPGMVFFAAGTVSDLDRSVNVRDWDVGLHVVFKSRKAHDDYQVAARHKQFIEENRSNWSQVRVFDTDLQASGEASNAAR